MSLALLVRSSLGSLGCFFRALVVFLYFKGSRLRQHRTSHFTLCMGSGISGYVSTPAVLVRKTRRAPFRNSMAFCGVLLSGLQGSEQVPREIFRRTCLFPASTWSKSTLWSLRALCAL